VYPREVGGFWQLKHWFWQFIYDTLEKEKRRLPVNPIYNFGIQLIQGMQTMSPVLDGVMKFFSFLGTIEFYLLLIPFVYWVISTQTGFRLLLVLISTDFIVLGFKQLLHQPRPYWIGDVKTLAEETSYGIPSSHASDSLAVWGYLAYRLKKDWLWALSIVVVLMIGISRMYLAVHFPTDVLAGWLIGLLVIVIFARGEGWASSRLEKLSAAGQIGIGFAVSVLMILAGWVIGLLIARFPDPPEWAQYALQARGISHYFTLAGALFGAAAGYVFKRAHANFQVRGAGWQRAVRYLLGMTGVLVIYFGLDVLFGLLAADESVVGLVLRYVRYGAVTFWTIFGAPWIFLKLKLAELASR
jgi:membrane-associated phospholipid phosphatase